MRWLSEAFLQHRLGFLGIADVVGLTLDKVEWRELASVDEVLQVDSEARAVASTLVASAS